MTAFANEIRGRIRDPSSRIIKSATEPTLNGEVWPEPPEVYRKKCEARDPAKALELFMPEDPTRALVVSTAVFDRYALVNERRLVPISYEPPVDLSER